MRRQAASVRLVGSSLCVLAAALLLSACASVPLAAPDVDARVKTMIPNSQKALIYLFRNEMMGALIKFEVSLDGRIVGKTAAKTFLVWEVDPGRHEIASEAENTDTLVIHAEAGKTYFVWQEVKMGGWYARNKLSLVDDAKGRAGVGECQLIQGTP